jgi:tRNA A37 N6-isopentenylltransferase MiaA
MKEGPRVMRIFVIGTTAVGKTKLGVRLAQFLGG